jgi:hypothetical protein
MAGATRKTVPEEYDALPAFKSHLFNYFVEFIAEIIAQIISGFPHQECLTQMGATKNTFRFCLVRAAIT